MTPPRIKVEQRVASPRAVGPAGRTLLWALLWPLPVAAAAIWWSPWLLVPAVVIGPVIRLAIEDAALYRPILRLRYRDALRRPTVLDEDAILRIPILLPDEQICIRIEDGAVFVVAPDRHGEMRVVR